MKKILAAIVVLALAGCTKQVVPVETNPQISEPTYGPERFIDQELGIVCYSTRNGTANISCVKLP